MPNTTTTTSNSSAPPWALPYWGSYLNGAAQQTQQPYQQYGGQRVANFSPEQQQGMSMITNRATNGSPLLSSAMSALQGMYGDGGGSSSYNFSMGGGGMGPEAQGSTGRNPLLDQSPGYLDDIIRRTGADTARDYATGTAAQNDARASRSRAFGGSAYEEQSRQNAASLADRLAGNASSLRYQDFNDRRGLEEAQLNRDLQSNMAQAQRQASLMSSGMSAAVSRDNARDNTRLSAIRMAGDFANQPYQDAQQLMNVGGMRQMYSQGLLDQNYGDWQAQQQYPWQQTDRFGQAISRATGGQGSQSSTSSQQTQSNPYANILGAGLGTAALWNMFRTPGGS